MRAAWRTSKWCVVYILVTCIAFDWYTLKYPMRDLPFLAHVWTLERFTVYHQKALDSIFILFLNMHVENTHWKKVWSIRGMNHAFHPSKIIRSIYSGVCLFVCLLLLLLLLLFFNESSEILWSSTSPLESFFDSPQLTPFWMPLPS